MPIYEYRCERGHTFEVLQRMTDDPVAVCTTCDAAVQRVLHPVAVHFKGSGFYTTDYAGKGRSGADSTDGKKDASAAGADPKGDKGSTGSKAETAKSSSSSSTEG